MGFKSEIRDKDVTIFWKVVYIYIHTYIVDGYFYE